jgi:hypothetical protein
LRIDDGRQGDVVGKSSVKPRDAIALKSKQTYFRKRRRAFGVLGRRRKASSAHVNASPSYTHLEHAATKRHAALPYEYGPRPRPRAFRVLLRGAGLASDTVVLLLASPFFAVWFMYRTGRTYLLGRKQEQNKRSAGPRKSSL